MTFILGGTASLGRALVIFVLAYCIGTLAVTLVISAVHLLWDALT